MFVYIALILLLFVACMGLAYEVRKRGEDLEQMHAAYQQQVEQLRAEAERQQAYRGEVEQLRAAHRQELERVRAVQPPVPAPEPVQPARQASAGLREERRDAARRQWLTSVAHTAFRNEEEVKIKFVSPLLHFLGYEPDDFSVQVPVDLRVGRQAMAGQADWVIWELNRADENRVAATVIEVLAPDEALNEDALTQVRSYAFGLGAPFYVLTNGEQFQLYRRDVRTDELLVDCAQAEFSNCWPQIYDLLGVR